MKNYITEAQYKQAESYYLRMNQGILTRFVSCRKVGERWPFKNSLCSFVRALSFPEVVSLFPREGFKYPKKVNFFNLALIYLNMSRNGGRLGIDCEKIKRNYSYLSEFLFKALSMSPYEIEADTLPYIIGEHLCDIAWETSSTKLQENITNYLFTYPAKTFIDDLEMRAQRVEPYYKHPFYIMIDNRWESMK